MERDLCRAAIPRHWCRWRGPLSRLPQPPFTSLSLMATCLSLYLHTLQCTTLPERQYGGVATEAGNACMIPPSVVARRTSRSDSVTDARDSPTHTLYGEGRRRGAKSPLKKFFWHLECGVAPVDTAHCYCRIRCNSIDLHTRRRG